ncbi:MAG: LysE/ArgO family amino acid transporter [Marinosulfonomonas sp.]|nr:LysE/ArgO family amino acid transporter [Marinosulfonomonas sp.]
MFAAATTGFGTAFSLILAIGAQNAFVLRQGILRKHVFWICLLCASSDAILITAGVFGFGAIVQNHPMLPSIMAWAGGGFLLFYGAARFRAAQRGDYSMVLQGESAPLMSTLAIGAALTWANPHVYLDTLGLIGAVSTRFHDPSQNLVFALGAISASFIFFFGLGYGARILAPYMQSPKAWKILDVGIGSLMWIIAAGLLAGV